MIRMRMHYVLADVITKHEQAVRERFNVPSGPLTDIYRGFFDKLGKGRNMKQFVELIGTCRAELNNVYAQTSRVKPYMTLRAEEVENHLKGRDLGDILVELGTYYGFPVVERVPVAEVQSAAPVALKPTGAYLWDIPADKLDSVRTVLLALGCTPLGMLVL